MSLCGNKVAKIYFITRVDLDEYLADEDRFGRAHLVLPLMGPPLGRVPRQVTTCFGVVPSWGVLQLLGP